MFGIYVIENTFNGKVYIGAVGKGRSKTHKGKRKTFHERLSEHVKGLNNKKHHNRYLQASWNKYRQEAFLFDILEIIDDVSLLDTREKFWIEYYSSAEKDYGYNLTLGGEGQSPNEETMAKLRKNNAMKRPEIANKVRLMITGRTISNETRKRQSEAKAGRYLGENHPFYGKHHSDETKAKLSASHMGKPSHRRGKLSITTRGENNPNVKLTKYQVREIRALLTEGFALTLIAKTFNVSDTSIANIRNGRTWTHVV